MLIKGLGAPPPKKERLGPLALRRQHCKVAPRDVFNDTMLAGRSPVPDQCPGSPFIYFICMISQDIKK